MNQLISVIVFFDNEGTLVSNNLEHLWIIGAESYLKQGFFNLKAPKNKTPSIWQKLVNTQINQEFEFRQKTLVSK